MSPGSVTLYSKALPLPINSLPEDELVVFSVKCLKMFMRFGFGGLPADGGLRDPHGLTLA